MKTQTDWSTTSGKVIDSGFPTDLHRFPGEVFDFELGSTGRRSLRPVHTSFVDQTWASTAIVKLLAADMVDAHSTFWPWIFASDPGKPVPHNQTSMPPVPNALGAYMALGVDYSAYGGSGPPSDSDSLVFSVGGILDFVTAHWLVRQDPEELFPDLVATVNSYMASESAVLERPLPEGVGRAALRMATALARLTGYEPFISADDEGSALVTVRLDEQRLIYVEIAEDSFEGVMYAEGVGTVNLKAKTERDLLREVMGMLA